MEDWVISAEDDEFWPSVDWEAALEQMREIDEKYKDVPHAIRCSQEAFEILKRHPEWEHAPWVETPDFHGMPVYVDPTLRGHRYLPMTREETEAWMEAERLRQAIRWDRGDG